MAATVTDIGALGSFDTAIKRVKFDSDTTTAEVATGMSVVYAVIPVKAAFADDNHTAGAIADIEVDEAYDSDVGGISVDDDGDITINRIETDDATTVATTQEVLLVIIGKSKA